MSVEMVWDEESMIKKKKSVTSRSEQVEMWDKTAKGGGMLQLGSSMFRRVTDGGGAVNSNITCGNS
jgi:hypothetical protein